LIKVNGIGAINLVKANIQKISYDLKRKEMIKCRQKSKIKMKEILNNYVKGNKMLSNTGNKKKDL
jgi:hypothetical protein